MTGSAGRMTKKSRTLCRQDPLALWGYGAGPGGTPESQSGVRRSLGERRSNFTVRKFRSWPLAWELAG